LDDQFIYFLTVFAIYSEFIKSQCRKSLQITDITKFINTNYVSVAC